MSCFLFLFRQLRLWLNTLTSLARLSFLSGKGFVRHPAALTGTAAQASHVILGFIRQWTETTSRSRFVSLNPNNASDERRKNPNTTAAPCAAFWFLNCWFNTKVITLLSCKSVVFYKPLQRFCNEADGKYWQEKTGLVLFPLIICVKIGVLLKLKTCWTGVRLDIMLMRLTLFCHLQWFDVMSALFHKDSEQSYNLWGHFPCEAFAY